MRTFQLLILLSAVAGVVKSLLYAGSVFFMTVWTVRPERRSSVVRRSLMARETNQSTIWEFAGMGVLCFIYKFYLFVFECY